MPLHSDIRSVRLRRVCAFMAVLHSTFTAVAEADLIGRSWTQRYDGTDHPLFSNRPDLSSYDHAEAVAVDRQGNAVVAARSDGFHVSKYAAADGGLLWEQRVGTNAFFASDSALAVAVDQQGNVVATGIVNNDWYTAKYAGTDGRILWERSYAGIGNDRDVPKAIAIDPEGHVVVTGTAVVHGKARSEVCHPFGTICHYPAETDFYTVKYDGRDGRVLWEQWFDGPDRGSDAPAGVALDKAGHAIVTGYTTVKRPDGSVNNDIYTLKYAAADGGVIWRNRLDHGRSDWPHAVAIDPAGDVVLAGRLGNAALAKVAGSSGETMWTRTDFSDAQIWLGALSVDGKGNIAVAGACSTWDDRDGDASYHPLGDRVYTAKLSPSGQLLWEQKYSRPQTSDPDLGAGSVRFASNGDVLIAGAAAISTSPYSWRLYAAKYSGSDGAILWEKLFSAIGPQLEEVFGGMILDANDAPLLVGNLYPRAPGAGDDVDIFVMKLGPVGQLMNISSRVQTGAGPSEAVAGFIVTSPSAAPKRVLIRGLGPSLGSSGLGGTLRNPAIELRTSDGRVITNDDWRESQQPEIAATGAAPADDAESALVATLPPGAHTVVLRGVGDEQGIGLIEVYDLSGGNTATTANLSTRGQIQHGANLLIGGFIVGSQHSGRVLVRAIGPTLPVSGALADPVLELHDANGALLMNDNWRSSQESEIRSTGIPPRDDRESAILAMLAPGPYTAVVRGKDDATGVGLIEVYNVQ